ncbi:MULTISPECIES: DUF29 domain-containing protein [unclassified Neisseria]|uniref:DUF29 domain-containing protein n=1 Tax=unclassified Neisseria TaxID=2623750 RepID=UPI001072A5D2|nr:MULTISPECIES: DUF29 domain-containing protein [unclassified Neisseria]MBF0804911.1 DUF29 domain-containing protein [Neisseria sp. 19428wB4_WF04]TFU39375.1 DUF29 domain-containing protein [Neisseria sp. WF04]
MTTSYDTDFAAWAAEQAGLLRAGLVDKIDFRNLAEEIEDMGKSEQRALESRLQVLICHLLKWKFQPERRGNSWKATIYEQRRGIRKLLKESPSLKSRFDDAEFVLDAWLDGVAAALRETELENTFPEQAVWSMADILNDEFLPE